GGDDGELPDLLPDAARDHLRIFSLAPEDGGGGGDRKHRRAGNHREASEEGLGLDEQALRRWKGHEHEAVRPAEGRLEHAGDVEVPTADRDPIAEVDVEVP